MQVLVLLTLAGGVLRFATLDGQSFWFDEAATLRLLHKDVWGMLGAIPDTESTPPLYYLLAWLWTRPLGTGEVGVRSLSALLGTAAIPVFYLAARELCSHRAGLAVAALAALNPLLVWYSQEARAYSLLVLLAGLSLWGFARLLQHPDGNGVVLWALASALALATHYFAVFLVVPELAWLLAARRTRRVALPGAVAIVGSGLALLPLALHQRSLDLAGYIDESSLPVRVARTGKSLLLGYESPLEVAAAVVAVVIAAAAAAVALSQAEPEEERRGARMAAVFGGAAVALPLVLAFAGADYVEPRNLLVSWLPLAVVVAAGLASRRLAIAGLAVLCALGLASIVGIAAEPRWQRDDWRGIARALGPPESARALVLQPQNGALPLGAYLGGVGSFPARGARVREVAVVYPVRRATDDVHPSPPPRRLPALPGFGVLERRETDSYTVVVLRAPAPVLVSIGSLLPLALVPDEGASLALQRTGQGGSRPSTTFLSTPLARESFTTSTLPPPVMCLRSSWVARGAARSGHPAA